ncbi:hypothetical protein HK099_002574 [Clydaea vesicula]|uniref:Uncharacterized protein n=1 Tax=Clydaea vesicula TaxID=447962 RepID=A0AAD5TV61_9FUNG|nr:hypothetical protein HK099_002574 [Clydaea vesicula]
MVATGVAAKHGILVRGGGAALQQASKVTAIAFDKTGTLTIGQPSVTNELILIPNPSIKHVENLSQFWRYLILTESGSDHPLSRCIREYAKEKLKSNPPDTNEAAGEEENFKVLKIQEFGGKGVKATFKLSGQHSKSVEFYCGSKEFITENDCHVVDGNWVDVVADGWKRDAKTIVYCGIKIVESKRNSIGALASQRGVLAGILAISDVIRPESFFVIEKLKNLGIQVWMLTGDNYSTGTAVARILGVNESNVLAGILPNEKKIMVEKLQVKLQQKQHLGCFSFNKEKNSVVAMVGDGINDSPALAQSDVGIAIGAGSDIAVESAQVILVRSDLRDVLTLLDLSKKTFKKVKMNLFYAFLYNIIGIPLASGCFYFIKINENHVLLSPWVAGLAMALSSVSVVLSSLTLKFYKPPLSKPT